MEKENENIPMDIQNDAVKPVDRKYYTRSYYIGLNKLLGMRNRFTRVKVDRVAAMLRPQAGEMILDIGCAVGTMAIRMSGSGASIINLDFSEDSMRVAKENFGELAPGKAFRGVCTDCLQMGIKNESIDAVMAVDFTEHVYDDCVQPVFTEIHRVLKRGRRFVIYTPNVKHLFERLKKRNIILKENKSHVGLRTMDDYVHLLKKCGFQIEKSFFKPTHIPVYSWIERIFMGSPFVGDLFKRRICILAIKDKRP